MVFLHTRMLFIKTGILVLHFNFFNYFFEITGILEYQFFLYSILLKNKQTNKEAETHVHLRD